MHTILVTGFEPFGDDHSNASQDTLACLRAPQGWQLETCVLPVVFGASFDVLERALSSSRPEIILCLGQANGRRLLSLERVAVNWIDAMIVDNAGARPRDVPISPTGPAAFLSRLPLRRLYERLNQRQIPVEISNTAGLYVCNYIFYRLMQAVAELDCCAGFIHVPATPSAVHHEDSQELTVTARALQIILDDLCYMPPV